MFVSEVFLDAGQRRLSQQKMGNHCPVAGRISQTVLSGLFLFLSTYTIFSSLFRVSKGMKIVFKDKISSLVSPIAFLWAQARYCHCGRKIQPLFARHSCIFLMTSLTKLRRDGRAGWVCSFKLPSAPYDQKKKYLQLELGDFCAHMEQSNQPCVLLSLLALPLGLTLTNVKLLFFHGSGGMSLVGYAQAPFSCSPDIRLSNPPKLTLIASAAVPAATPPVLVGGFRNA